MTNNTTKRALISSAVALFLCFAMLLGTTFAWFTDEVSSEGNKIVAGTLDVQLFMHDANGRNEITDSSAPLFGPGSLANENTAETLWEPGKTQTVYLSIKNNGTLDLKYQVAIEVYDVEKNLHEVMSYIITPDAQYESVTKADLDWENGVSVVPGYNVANAADTALLQGEEHFFALSVHMDELAGNEYQDGSITFDIKVIAGQLASEEDSFDNQYDVDAIYPNYGGTVAVDRTQAAQEIVAYDPATGVKIATALVPADAIAEDAQNLSINAKLVETNPNVTVMAGSEAMTYEVTVSGLKSDNTEPIVVELRIPTGLDPASVQLYHYENAIPFVYKPADGLVRFETATFSPFTIVYDAESEFVPEVVDPNAHPEATVERVPQFENTELPWGNFGGFTPTAGLDAELESAFKFTCQQTPEEAAADAYANWYCDFYVSLDRDLGENEIFLGGNYGSFGWIGFHNGDITLPANEEIGLLSSVTSNPWTYADIASFVGEFTCGVGDVDDALAGATFTVMLRLTNPEDSSDYINVSTITHVFTESEEVAVEGDAALDSALAGATGDIEVTLSEGTYTLPSNIASENVTITGNGANTVFDFTQVNSANGANITFAPYRP